MMEWVAQPQDDLPAAMAEFRAKLPGWWYTLGECNISSDASCGPDFKGCHAKMLKDKVFDYGFHADIPPPATIADALRDVMGQALAAIEARAGSAK